ncbi:MAG: hypothetical protein HY281_01840 [Nitrospirae bacterium]|nr:hypothetical protein [Nitrospirota bacterium]
MKGIHATFQRISDISLDTALNAVGVYVLWKGRSRVRPAYLGQGYIIQRILGHAKGQLSGVVAIFDRGTPNQNKTYAEIVEAALLDIAEEVDRFPTENSKRGNWKEVLRAVSRHGKLRVTVREYDPLLWPGYPRMSQKKVITIYPVKDEYGDFGIAVDRPWNTRSPTPREW